MPISLTVFFSFELEDEMGFGTPKYDAILWSDRFGRGGKFRRKKKPNQNHHYRNGNGKNSNSEGHQKTESQNEPCKSENGAIYPALPEGWVKRDTTVTGDASYDETMREIKSKLKRTMVRNHIFYYKSFNRYQITRHYFKFK